MAIVNGTPGFTQLTKLNVIETLLEDGNPVVGVDVSVTDGQILQFDQATTTLIFAGATVDQTTGEWTFDQSINTPAGSVNIGTNITLSDFGEILATRNNATGINELVITGDEISSEGILLPDIPTAAPVEILAQQLLSDAVLPETTAQNPREFVLDPSVFTSNVPSDEFLIIDSFRIFETIPPSGQIRVQLFIGTDDTGHKIFDGIFDVIVGTTNLSPPNPQVFRVGTLYFSRTVPVGEGGFQLRGTMIGPNLVAFGDIRGYAIQRSKDVTRETAGHSSDNYLRLNDEYTTGAGLTGGIVQNSEPTSTIDTVTDGQFTNGVAAVSNPTVVTDGSATFAQNDIVIIKDTNFNNGYFEVESHIGSLLTVRGVGTVAAVEDFTKDNFVLAVDTAVITKTTPSIMRSGTDGLWEVGQGSVTPIIFNNVLTGPDTVFTEGSVLFAGPSGDIAQDNANFFYDDTNNLFKMPFDTIFPQISLGATDTLEFRHSGTRGFIDAGGNGLIIEAKTAGGTIINTLGATNGSFVVQSSLSVEFINIQDSGNFNFINPNTTGVINFELGGTTSATSFNILDNGLLPLFIVDGTGRAAINRTTISNVGLAVQSDPADLFVAVFEQDEPLDEALICVANLATANVANGATLEVSVRDTLGVTPALRIRGSYSDITGATRDSLVQFQTRINGVFKVPLELNDTGTTVNLPTDDSLSSFTVKNDSSADLFFVNGAGRASINTSETTQQLNVFGGIRSQNAATSPTRTIDIVAGTGNIDAVGSNLSLQRFSTNDISMVMGGGTVNLGGAGVTTVSALFDVNSTTKGSIPAPKMTTAERDAIATPTIGLQVFNITTDSLQFFDGTVWADVGRESSRVRVSTAVSTSTAALGVADFYAVTDTTAARTLTISTADVVDGRTFIFKDESGAAGTNNITIDTEGTETIDGVSAVGITVNHGAVKIYSDGTNLFSW